MNKVLLIITVVSLLFSQSELSYDFGVNIRLHPTQTSQNFPDMIFDSNNTMHLVWIEQVGANNNIFYSRSDELGLSFSDPIQVNVHSNSIVAYMQSGPLVRVRGNELFIVYMDDRTGSTSIYLNRSPDNGFTWETEMRISDQPYLEMYTEIEIDNDGKIHLIYYSYNQNYSLNSVRYAIAPENTIDFYPSNPVGLVNNETEPCDCCQPDLELSESGDVFIAYRNNLNNIRDHYLVKKSVNSDVFSAPVPISDYQEYLSFCPSSGPSLVLNDQWIAAGYNLNVSQNSFINFSGLQEINFSNEVNLNPQSSEEQNFPFLTIHDDFIHAVWMDYSNGAPDIFYAVSEINLGQISNVQRVNDDGGENNIMQKDPFLAWQENNLYCFWSDQRDGNFQIYFSTTNDFDILEGDVDNNGEVDFLDSLFLINIILSHDPPTTYELLAGDINHDGELTLMDSIMINFNF